jgi:hypothetical protein
VAGAWLALSHLIQGAGAAPIAHAILGAGFFDAVLAVVMSFAPADLISTKQLIPGSAIPALKDVSELALSSGAVDVAQLMIDAGLVDVMIDMLREYQTLSRPNDASVGAVWYGALFGLEVCLSGATDPAPIMEKLHCIPEIFHYLRENPLFQLRDLGLDTRVNTAKIAALVWGRDEDFGGFEFKQEEIDSLIVDIDHRKEGNFNVMHHSAGQHILSVRSPRERAQLPADSDEMRSPTALRC